MNLARVHQLIVWFRMRATNCMWASTSIASKIMHESMLPLFESMLPLLASVLPLLASIGWLLGEKVLTLASMFSWAWSLNRAVLYLCLARVIISCKPNKMLPNKFLTSIYILVEVFSQLDTYQLPKEPFREHTCTHGHQTGHKNKPWGKQAGQWSSYQLLADGWSYRLVVENKSAYCVCPSQLLSNPVTYVYASYINTSSSLSQTFY